jgi:hypothetical protein
MDSRVVHLIAGLELGVSEVLGVSLSEVCARYFGDSDIGEDLVEERNYGVLYTFLYAYYYVP